LDEECQDLLKQYEESGDPDIADHLIESQPMMIENSDSVKSQSNTYY